MKPLLCAVSAIALILPSVIAAQPSGTQQNQSQQRPGRPSGERPQNRPSRPSGQRPNHRPRPPTAVHPTQPIRPPSRPGVRPPHFRPIHRPGFRWPHGYRYRRRGIGSILPHIFLSNYYYFNDWRLLGLGPPPPGFVWVRYGPDLLLVDRRTGRIRRVIYGAFY